MLFFDDAQLEQMQRRFAISRWRDFDESFLLQPAPRVLKPYDVLRWDGSRFSRATTTDAKFASWIITENSVAHRLSDDAHHLDAATRLVTAARDTPAGDDRSPANLDDPAVRIVAEHLEQFGSAYGAAFLAAVPEPHVGAALVGMSGLVARKRMRHR